MIPTKRQLRFFNITKEIALTSKGVGGRNGNNFRIGAILVYNGNIISSGVNSYRTSPRLEKLYEYPYFHAEAKAILNCGLYAASGCSLYVVRVCVNGSMAMAKPCLECQELLKLANIRKIYYSLEDGYGQI